MGILDLFKSRQDPVAPAPEPVAHAPAVYAFAMQSPEFYEFVRNGGEYGVEQALKNSAVMRAVDLISGVMGALPLQVVERRRDGAVVIAEDHPLHDVLMYRPNGWQTGLEFRQLMQAWALIHGNAYARIVRVGRRVSALLPIDPRRVTVEQQADFSLRYTVSTDDNARGFNVDPADMFHLRGLSLDGVTGISRVKQAADVINTALQAQLAQTSLFKNGVVGGMALEHPGKLSPAAHENLRTNLANDHTGASNAGKVLILEEGMKRTYASADAVDLQIAETQAAQIAEIARVFGVPRPLMMVEETSWGSGIEQLAILFVRFCLAPWFVAWEQAVDRALLDVADRRRFRADYDERELLRGTLKDQAEYFAKALGAGGHRPWMEANEVRDLSGLGRHADGAGLVAAGGSTNAQDQTPPVR